jgi:hypothetical protein
MCWLLINTTSYMQHRLVMNVFQRLRHIAVMRAFKQMGTAAVIMESFHFNKLLQPGTLGAFLTVTCVVPL